MKPFTIDTLQFSKRMQKAGLQKEVADELAEAIKEVQSESINDLATKQDLKSLENDILLKVGKMIYVSTGVIVTIIGLSVAIIKI